MKRVDISGIKYFTVKSIGKGLVFVRCRKPHACSCSGAVHHRQKQAFTLGCSQSSHTCTLDLVAIQPHEALVSGVTVSIP